MKKRGVLAAAILFAALSTVFAGCGHEHDFSDKWTQNATHHWHAATCKHDYEKSGYGEHEAGEWITVTPATHTTEGVRHKLCKVCGCEVERESIGMSPEHEWGPYQHDGADHWQECACGMSTQYEHHEMGEEWHSNATDHWHVCTVCGFESGKEGHKYQITCHDDEYHWEECYCGGASNTKRKHVYQMTYDANYHWEECAHDNCEKINGTKSPHDMEDWHEEEGVTLRRCRSAGCNYTERQTAED